MTKYEIPPEVVPIAVKLWLDMQTGIKRDVLQSGQCRFDLAVDCPVCGRENKLIMYLYSGGRITVECIGILPNCGYYVWAEVPALMSAEVTR